MVTVVRYDVKYDEDAPLENGFQLLLAVLDAEGRNHTTTWIDAPVMREAVSKLKTRKTQIDPVAQRAMAMELEHHGPPHPIEIKAPPAVFCASPIEVRWEDFMLKQTGGVMHLHFTEPGSGSVIQMQLTAQANRMSVACATDVVPLGTGMAYSMYPKMRLTGTRDGKEISGGRGWLDHQWGDVGWFHDPGAGMLLGWDWFGINMDDGSDWVIMMHRNARTSDAVAMHATVRNAAGFTLTTHSFTLTKLRAWESPRTHIHYPVAWRLEIAEFDAVLMFDPMVDDQEVPTFGINRSVWEGVGTVCGTVGGVAVTGQARGEFHGYGYVFDHEEFVRGMAERVDARLEELIPRSFDTAHVESLVGPARWQHETDAYTKSLSVPVWDLIDRSGKRWRPLFGILLLESLNVPSAPYEGLICCMTELIHAGALVIDDIEDNSLLRRGQECLHLRYGVDVALNAGNSLYFLPGSVLMKHPLLSADQRLRLHGIKEQVCIEAHCGQATDIFWSKTLTPDELRRRMAEDAEPKILQMYAFKTAAASKGVAQFAAVIADTDAETMEACADFGLALGVCYQVIDDIHNFSRSPQWTKTAGEDIATGKLTYVIATALRKLDAAPRARLEQILCSNEMRSDPALVLEATEIVRESGALETCREIAREMTETAWERFSRHLPSSQPKIMLHTMALKLIDLAFDG